jgi:hypothetical protein
MVDMAGPLQILKFFLSFNKLRNDAASLFAAAYTGIRQWSGLSWFSGNLKIEVRADGRRWRP